MKGKVTKLTNFGVFVELEPGLEGLLHISELADHKVDSPEEVVKVGDEIEVKVLRVDRGERKIGLSRKKAHWTKEDGDEEGGESRPRPPAPPRPTRRPRTPSSRAASAAAARSSASAATPRPRRPRPRRLPPKSPRRNKPPRSDRRKTRRPRRNRPPGAFSLRKAPTFSGWQGFAREPRSGDAEPTGVRERTPATRPGLAPRNRPDPRTSHTTHNTQIFQITYPTRACQVGSVPPTIPRRRP